jgi:hypothetical protein
MMRQATLRRGMAARAVSKVIAVPPENITITLG